jgi:hypothetical protein
VKKSAPIVAALLYTLALLGSLYIELAWPRLGGPAMGFVLFLGSPLALVAALVYTVLAKAQPWRRRILPLVLLLAPVPLLEPVREAGQRTREALFRRNLPVYEAALEPIRVESGPRSVILSLDSLPYHARLCCVRASARIEADGSFRASFAVHRDLRMVYSPTALDTGDIGAPFRIRRVPFAPNWYEEWH